MPVGVYERTKSMMTGKHMRGRAPWNKGKKNLYSKDTLEKMVKNHSNYKDGISIGENKKPYTDGYNKDYRRKLRLKTLEIMGNKCVKCGFDDKRALQIDHIHGGGNKERKLKEFLGQGTGYHNAVIKSYESGENKYQLLCANCNWIKRYENNELYNCIAK